MWRNLWIVCYALISISAVNSRGWFWQTQGNGWNRRSRSGEKKEYICDRQSRTISCSTGFVLNIISAEYGRTNYYICRTRHVRTLRCRKDVLAKVGSLCEKKGRCKLRSSTKQFGNPCRRTAKYLRLVYKCIRDKNECMPNPCTNDGKCIDGNNGYSCECKPGFKGQTCEIDKDDCEPSPCQNGGTCTDKVNDYTCRCKPGYIGDNCETDKDDCEPSPCQNGGTCTDKVNGYTCRCKPGYIGDNCETDQNDCDPPPCQNGATCTDYPDGYSCSCKQGYSGYDCEQDIDDCTSEPCGKYGKCRDGVNSFDCICQDGYAGKTCQTKVPPAAYKCGIAHSKPILFQPRIVGGIVSVDYSWPWVTQLSLNNKHECGAAIIAPRWIATAKHCFLKSDNVTKWTACAGKTHKIRYEPKTQQLRNVVKIVKCPHEGHNFLNKDLALVKVDKDFTFNNYVQPICLPWRDPRVGDRCFVKGWGHTKGTGNDTVLKQTLMPIRDTKKCNTTINVSLKDQITRYMFCAGFAAGGHDACQGDSGGPLDCRLSDNKWYLSGIVSWGIGCADANMPGVYSNVKSLAQWIEDQLANN